MLTLVWKPNAVWREAKAGRVQKNVRRDEGYPPFHSHTGTGTHTHTHRTHTHAACCPLSLFHTPAGVDGRACGRASRGPWWQVLGGVFPPANTSIIIIAR